MVRGFVREAGRGQQLDGVREQREKDGDEIGDEDRHFFFYVFDDAEHAFDGREVNTYARTASGVIPMLSAIRAHT